MVLKQKCRVGGNDFRVPSRRKNKTDDKDMVGKEDEKHVMQNS